LTNVVLAIFPLLSPFFFSFAACRVVCAISAVLCENGRLNMITEVIKDFSALMRAHRKQIVVSIYMLCARMCAEYLQHVCVAVVVHVDSCVTLRVGFVRAYFVKTS